jgi:hypothetical protein
VIDRAVPGVRRHPRVKGGNLPLGDRGVEALSDERGERRVQVIELRVEFFPGSERFNEEQARQEAVASEGVQHFTQRGVASPKRIGLRRHRDFDAS